MASLEEIRNTRLEKLERLKKVGMNPYPISTEKDFDLKDLIADFEKVAAKEKPVSLVGRVVSLRPQGGLIFFHFDDGTGKFQGLLKKAEGADDASFDLFFNAVDIGDFIEVKGKLFVTKRQEKTVQVESWKMLSKSLLPLPEKWHGLQDVEERFRKRYLDTLMSAEVRERFIKRTKIVSEIRRFLDSDGFLEVETPVFQPLYGGASAAPFTTHHNALDSEFYLRISDELYLKRLLIGGFPKVYEIGRDFRNEGIDTTHNPEFTMIEWYEAFSDAPSEMKRVEKLLKSLVKKLFDGASFVYDGVTLDLSKKFAVISYFELLQRYALIPHPEKITRDEIALEASKLGVKVAPSDTLEKIMDSIYKKMCRPKLIQPTFIIDYPAAYLPLAKYSAKDAKFVDAFQLVMGGIEIVKAFSELNDPIDQRERLTKQEETKKGGDAEAQSLDTDFIEAMEHGMPPAGGVGIGIDRLTMLLTDTKNIREVILFPTLRPR